MLLKNFFFNFYLISTNILFILSLFFILSVFAFLTATLRNKLVLFLQLVFIFSVWGFLYNLDGMFLILLTAEFTILLLFFMTYTQLYSQFNFFIQKKLSKKIIIVLVLIPVFSDLTPNLYYVNFYQSLTHVVTSDFFIIYYLLFDKLPLLTIFITLIISLFSLFFILIYFTLKSVKNEERYKVKQLYFLRKQNLQKQTNFSSKLYTFQN